MIYYNDNKDKCIDITCYCRAKHCSGELIVQPDTIKGEKVFMITAIDTRGNDEASLWITKDQIDILINELRELINV